MFIRKYKNHNIVIRHESFYDGEPPASFFELFERLQNDIDGVSIENIEEAYAGNDYAYYYLSLWVNGKPRYYRFDSDMLEQYRAGHAVRLIYESDAALFIMPPYYKYEWTPEGGLYWLREEPSEAQADEMLGAGCRFMTSVCEYAPEIKSRVLFVPRGVTFEF